MAKIYFNNHSLDLARAKIFNALSNEGQINLFNAVELSSGDYLPKSKMDGGKYKVYGGGGLTLSTHTSYNVENETIGIGRVGARCGCVFIIEAKSWVTDNALFVSSFKKKYDLNFLSHYLNHINLNQFANQSAQPVISQRGIAKCTIPNVEFFEQEQIGAILNAIEKKEDFKDVYNLKNILEFERTLASLNEELNHQQTYLQLIRQTILQEAVQGELMKQDPADEPATELLKRIKKEKETLVKEGKGKKEKELPPIGEDEIPFALPEGWIWCRLGEVGILKRGKSKHRPRNDRRLFDNGSYPFIQTGEVSQAKKQNGCITLINGYYNEFGLKQSEVRKKGTLCITIAANIAEYGFLTFDACVPDSIVCFNSNDDSLSKYVSYFIDISKDMLEQFAPSTAQKNINLGILNELKFPLPPLPEQQRIVAKVQQLQHQIQGLETQVQQSRAYAQQFLQSVLREAFEQKNKAYEIKQPAKLSLVAEE